MAEDGLRVLRTTHVVPSPSAEPALAERALPLTFMDAAWLHFTVESVFLYRLAPGADVAGVLSKIAGSLPAALRTFYPLSGRVRPTPGKANRYELFYQLGDGVAFTIAELDGVGVDELVSDEPREVCKIAPLVPRLPEGGAVLALQATVLLLPAARRGLALGVTVHHAACDGVGSTHFLHTWAAACAGSEVSPQPPVIDRTLIRDREDMHEVFAAPRPRDDAADEEPTESARQQVVLATFTLSREYLQGVKDTVAGEAARRGTPLPRCTSIVATFGVIWQCHCRTEAEPRVGRANIIFSMDLRARLEPLVPEKYLGNCVGPCLVSAPREEVSAAGADGLFAACSAVAAGISEAARAGAGCFDGTFERLTEACRDGPPLSVAGSPRFRVYDVDFGFGRPAKVEIVSVAKTAAMSVAESRGDSSGIEVGVALAPERMEVFRRCFADAMASNSVN